MQMEQQQDYQCKFCKLFFNDSMVDPDAVAERAEQLQIHFASNCPVLQQIALVLQPLHGRSIDARSIGHGTSAVLSTPGATPDAGEPVHAGKRRRAAEQEAQTGARWRRQGRSATQPTEQGPSHADPPSGQGGPPTRSGNPDGSQTGLLRYLCPSQRGGSAPVADVESQEWKDMTEKTTTLRTYLLKHLILEIQQRAIKLSQSSQGTQLWDVAVTKGVILQDGSWPFQQWCHTEKKLTKSHRAPLPMSRILKDLQFMVDLLTDNDHVMRFHSLRPQANVVPWMLQLNMREDDLWRLFHQLSQSTLWGLMGLSLKQHNQQVSKPAQLLEQLTNTQGTAPKGRGKGKTKTKANKSPVARDPPTGGCKADTWQYGPYVLCQQRLHLLFVVGPEQTPFHHYRLGTPTCFVSCAPADTQASAIEFGCSTLVSRYYHELG